MVNDHTSYHRQITVHQLALSSAFANHGSTLYLSMWFPRDAQTVPLHLTSEQLGYKQISCQHISPTSAVSNTPLLRLHIELQSTYMHINIHKTHKNRIYCAPDFANIFFPLVDNEKLGLAAKLSNMFGFQDNVMAFENNKLLETLYLVTFNLQLWS